MQTRIFTQHLDRNLLYGCLQNYQADTRISTEPPPKTCQYKLFLGMGKSGQERERAAPWTPLPMQLSRSTSVAASKNLRQPHPKHWSNCSRSRVALKCCC